MDKVRHAILFPKQKRVIDLLEKDSNIEEVYFGGAAGPGKSFLGCLWQMYRRCKYPETRGLIGRANFTDLEDTTVKTFWTAWEKFGRYNPFKVTCWRSRNTILFSNGSEILLKWVRDRGGPTTDENFGFGSLELTDLFIDEVTEVPEGVLDIILGRIRYRLIKSKPAALLVSNPSMNWVKARYISDTNGKEVELKDHQAVVLATLADNKDEAFAKTYRARIEKLPPAARARLLGSWEYFENENPFFYSYTEELVDDYEYALIPYEPILLSFDFNVSPCTVIVAQKTEEYGLLVHRCIEAEGGTRGVLRALEPFQFENHPAGLIVTGDVSGFARHSSSAGTAYGDFQTDYGLIKKKLVLNNRDIKHTSHQNPRHIYSRKVSNYALHRKVVRFSRVGCSALTHEIKQAIPDSRGNLYKNRDKGHPNDRVDAFRYLINLAFPKGYTTINKYSEALGLTPNLDSSLGGDGMDSLREYYENQT